MKKMIVLLVVISCSLQFVYAQRYILSTDEIDRLKSEPYEKLQVIDTFEYGVLLNPYQDLHNTVQSQTFLAKWNDDNSPIKPFLWIHHVDSLEEPLAIRYNWGLYNPSFNPRENVDLLESLSKNEVEFESKLNEILSKVRDEKGKEVDVKVHIDSKEKVLKEFFWETEEEVIRLSYQFQRKLKPHPTLGYMLNHFQIELLVVFKHP